MRYTKLMLFSLSAFCLMACEQANEAKEIVSRADNKQEEAMPEEEKESLELKRSYLAEANSNWSANANSSNGNMDLGTPSAMVGIAQPMLLRSASLELKVDSLNFATEKLDSLLKACGGYIQKQEITGVNVEPKAMIQLRIPSQYFEYFIKQIRNSIGETRSIKVSSVDIGEEYNDLTMRLQTKRKVLERYQAILNRAGTIKEVLEAEREIGTIMEEIERVEGRMKYLGAQSSYSELKIDLFEWSDEVSIEPRFGFGDDIIKALAGGWKGVKFFLLIVLRIWPLILLSALSYLVFLKYKRTKKETGVN